MTEEGGERDECLVVDGLEVSISSFDGGRFHVIAKEHELGTLELVPGGAGFIARRVNGENVTSPSPWGGEVTARFQTRELAVRALLANRS